VPTIRVNDAVWAYLQQHARTPGDTPSAILERLLAIPEPQPRRVSDGEDGSHPQGAFRAPILQVLTELGGRAPKREVMARLAEIVVLTEADDERNIRGHCRWERRIASAAADMRREGILAHTQHGVWALARASRARV
jgi:hypothetical protein